MSNLARKIARQSKKQQAAQMIGLLNQLAPGLQEVEGRLQKVADVAPAMEQVYAEWEHVLHGLEASIKDVQQRAEQTRSTLLVLIHEVSGTSMPMAQFLDRARQLDEQYLETINRQGT